MVQKTKWVLIVEDNDDIREAMMMLVEQYGYHPKSARNGKEALSVLSECVNQPCLILLDWAMPTMSGKEFLEMQCAANIIVPIPVVVVSAAPPGKVPLGAMKILRKPFDIENLLQDIDKYCGENLVEQIVASAQIVGKEKFVATDYYPKEIA